MYTDISYIAFEEMDCHQESIDQFHELKQVNIKT